MSEAQAIETDDPIIEDPIVNGVIADEAITTETIEELEIVLEGEEQPPSKQVPHGLLKRFNKLNGKIDAATTEADDAKRRAQMLEEENKLLRLQAQQAKPVTRPDEDDFDTRKEYLAALDEYEDKRIEEKARTIAAQTLQETSAQTHTVNQDEKLKGKISEHYERASALKMKNFEELEDKAIDILGPDFSKIIMANTAKSHLIMGYLGANAGKAQELAEMLKSDPVGALVKAVEIGTTLSTRSKGTAPPDPETKLKSGSSELGQGKGSRSATYE